MFKRYIDGYDKKLMKKKGFKYCKEFNKFLLDGYGVYLTDIDKEKIEDYLNFFGKLGYEIVFGPLVSSDYPSSYLTDVGLYCKNYVDVLCNRAMLSEDIDDLVKRIVLVSNLKDQVMYSDEYLEKIVIDEIKFLHDVTNNLDIDDFYKVVSELNNIYNSVNKTNGMTLKQMTLGLSEYFYERVSAYLDKDVDKEKVSELVSEAKGLAYDLRMTRQYPFLTVWNPDTIEECAKEITGFVERVKKENTTSEIRGLLNGLKIDSDNYLEGTEYMVTILKGYAKNKTLDEYSSKVKVKEKK